LSAEHDGVLVADVVAACSARHRQPYRLHLTGGGPRRLLGRVDGVNLALDSVEFCRILSGRAAGH
jgi:hypothetical protein